MASIHSYLPMAFRDIHNTFEEYKMKPTINSIISSQLTFDELNQLHKNMYGLIRYNPMNYDVLKFLIIILKFAIFIKIRMIKENYKPSEKELEIFSASLPMEELNLDYLNSEKVDSDMFICFPYEDTKEKPEDTIIGRYMMTEKNIFEQIKIFLDKDAI